VRISIAGWGAPSGVAVSLAGGLFVAAESVLWFAHLVRGTRSDRWPRRAARAGEARV